MKPVAALATLGLVTLAPYARAHHLSAAVYARDTVVEAEGDIAEDIDYPHFDGRGIPLGRGAHVEERFALNADGSRLDYTMKVTDPATFTEPVTLAKQWEWRPGEQVRPYDCRR